MLVMLCKNRVSDYLRWKAVFDTHAAAHRAAGLRLIGLWREIARPDNVFFLFEISSLEKARAFISDPAAGEAGKMSGVIDGEYHFLETVAGC